MEHLIPRALISAVFALLAGCKSAEPTVQPESLDSMVLFDGPSTLLLEVLDAMRQGNVDKARASIATPGQIESMCPGYQVPLTPYTETNLDAATAKCQQVFAAIDDATFVAAMSNTDAPTLDPIFGPNWGERCPELKLYQFVQVIEVAHDPEAPQAGFEITDVFEYRGQWGLMTIPRCRGEE